MTTALQKLKYDTINFEKFPQLRVKFMNCNPKELKDLVLIKCNSKNLPPLRCLELLPNLLNLNLSQNLLDRFDASILTKGAPNLTELNLSDNQISTLDDIIDLGSLRNLSIFDFTKNPITSTIRRVLMIQLLLFPSKYKKFNPVEILTATYNEIPNPKLSEKDQELHGHLVRFIQKQDIEVSKEDLLRNQNKVSKYNHKNTLIKYAMDECPVDRKSRFPNLKTLNNEAITKLEVLRASGASNIQQLLNTKSSKQLIQPQIGFKRQNSEINEKYIQRYKKRMQKLLVSQQPLIYMSKDKTMTATGLGKFTGGTGDDDLKYLARLDEVNNLKRKNELDPKKFSVDLWEKPNDLKHKHAQFNISISDYKKMLIDYDKHKIVKQEEIKKRKEKYLEKVLGKKKNEYKKKKFKEALKLNNIKDEKELESDPEIRNIFKIKKRVIKPKLNLEMNLDKEYSTSESDASENLSNSIHNIQYSHEKESDLSEEEKLEEIMMPSLDTLRPVTIRKQNLMKEDDKNTKDMITSKRLMKNSIILMKNSGEKSPVLAQKIKSSLMKHQSKHEETQEKNKILPFSKDENTPKPKNPQRVIINEEDLLPNEDQGLPNDLKFNIFNEREDQYYQIMDVKRLVEDSENLIIDCKELDEVKVNENTELVRNINKKKISSFDKILEFLKEKDHDISEYIGPNTFLLRDIIYYVNEYKKTDEPKITEEEILTKLKQKKNLTEKDLEKLYKQLEILDSIKLKKKSLNDFFLKRIEQKEIQRAEANAVLAAHYLKLKKYYGDGTFDKYLKQLTIEHEDGTQVITKEQTKVVPSTGIDPTTLIKKEKQKRMSILMKEKILTEERTAKLKDSEKGKGNKDHKGVMKKWEELKEMKRTMQTNIPRQDVPITGFILDEIPNINEIVNDLKAKKLKLEPQKHFEELMEQNLRKIQEEFHSKDSKALSLEEKMIRYAQDFKENAKKREVLKANIEKHITDVRPLLDEYWRIEEKEHEKRYDEVYCFKNYVKKIREEEKV